MNKYELKETMRNGIVTVVFEKVDGTLREMRCTLQDQYLPQLLTEQQEAAKIRNENENVLAVWDVDNKGWRSFRVDSIKEVK